jgi:hypothetical protein
MLTELIEMTQNIKYMASVDLCKGVLPLTVPWWVPATWGGKASLRRPKCADDLSDKVYLRVVCVCFPVIEWTFPWQTWREKYPYKPTTTSCGSPTKGLFHSPSFELVVSFILLHNMALHANTTISSQKRSEDLLTILPPLPPTPPPATSSSSPPISWSRANLVDIGQLWTVNSQLSLC